MDPVIESLSEDSRLKIILERERLQSQERIEIEIERLRLQSQERIALAGTINA